MGHGIENQKSILYFIWSKRKIYVKQIERIWKYFQIQGKYHYRKSIKQKYFKVSGNRPLMVQQPKESSSNNYLTGIISSSHGVGEFISKENQNKLKAKK